MIEHVYNFNVFFTQQLSQKAEKIMDKNSTRKINGVSLKTLYIPTAIILAILHIAIIASIWSINNRTTTLAETNAKNGQRSSILTSLISGSSVLSASATTYVVMPNDEAGHINISALMAYAKEMAEPSHRGDSIKQAVKQFDISPRAQELLDQAVESSSRMLETQNKAIALVASVYPFPEGFAELKTIVLPELSESEKAMTDEEKLETAKKMLFSNEFSEDKGIVSRNIGQCNGILQEESNKFTQSLGNSVNLIRILLWVLTLSVVVVISVVSTISYRVLIKPLILYSELIKHDNYLNDKKGPRETRLLARSYNNAIKRRNSLENILRFAAETDTLTTTANRYAWERDMVDMESHTGSAALLFFDLNLLKVTNDKKGHEEGDKLIVKTADVITECFCNNNRKKCYRFGGDEFVVVIENVSIETVQDMIVRFVKMQEEKDISVSYGFAYSEDLTVRTIPELMKDADRQMYIKKEEMHTLAKANY